MYRSGRVGWRNDRSVDVADGWSVIGSSGTAASAASMAISEGIQKGHSDD
jgi:hypothetical protein